MSTLPQELLDVVRHSGTLCLDVENPGWGNARGYLFDAESETIYFPVSKKYVPTEPADFRVLIWSQPRVVVTGHVQSATSDEDIAVQLALAEASGLDSDEAQYMLLDQRSRRPRRTRHKLSIRELTTHDG